MNAESATAPRSLRTASPWHDVGRRFLADRAAIAGLIVLVLLILAAALGF